MRAFGKPQPPSVRLGKYRKILYVRVEKIKIKYKIVKYVARLPKKACEWSRNSRNLQLTRAGKSQVK